MAERVASDLLGGLVRGAELRAQQTAAPFVYRLEHELPEAPARRQHWVVRNEIVCFGGFGFPNPLDVWTSRDGDVWTKVGDSAWNAQSPAQGKYDFDALAVTGRGQKQSIMTFGGDRETFDFSDPENWTRVDDEVWRFGPG